MTNARAERASGASPRVAVIGARGIGRHHAKWFHTEGADVVAIVGMDSARLAGTTAELRRSFPFAGRGYTDVQEMLGRESPDVVVIASPPQFHLEHADLAIAHGAHIYVEKPIIWDETRPAERWLQEARHTIQTASEHGLLVGMNAQYAAAWEAYEASFGSPLEGTGRSLYVELETASLSRERTFQGIWVDLGSHPISILLKVLPDGRIVERTADIRIDRHETSARFDFTSDDRTLRVEFLCRSVESSPPRRRFGLDEVIVDYEVRVGRVTQTILRHGDREDVITDVMHESIRRFVDAVRTCSRGPIVTTGEAGIRNLEIQAQLFSLART